MTHEFDEDATDTSVGPPPPLPPKSDASLLVLSGPAAGQYHRVPPNGATIGRGHDVDIQITDPTISRRHAHIGWGVTGKLEVRDLNSHHGLYVEGQRVTCAIPHDGDRIQLSPNTVLRLRYQDNQETDVMDRVQETISRDPLTQVGNRRAFNERLEQEFAFAKRHDASLTLMMIDVDRFKTINDTYGHQAGDTALRSIARTLREAIRLEDVLARYGGDEFVILLRGHSDEEARNLAQRIGAMARSRPFRSGDAVVATTLSIGISMFGQGAKISMMDLIARADAALYAAKHRGRDRAVLWSSLSDDPRSM
ncbi:MAG: GGDEF domain-containing protein [Deltaproteobacteria bacterium]|nr:GGDEF domain-containing protein [Deltaproteobacteria bacterium]